MRGSVGRLLAVVALVVAGCELGLDQFTPPPIPTQAAALAYLDQVVAAVEARDLERLCRIGGSNCQNALDESDPAAVPDDPPVVVRISTLASTKVSPGTWSVGGVVIELCGLDGVGKPYTSEMLVFDEGSGRLISINTVYWTGVRIARDNTAVATAAPAEPCPGLAATPSP